MHNIWHIECVLGGTFWLPESETDILIDCKDVMDALMSTRVQKTKHNDLINTRTREAATSSLLSISQKISLSSSLYKPSTFTLC